MTDHTLARADEVLTELVELVETARTVPMSSSCVVPRERTLDLLDALREVLPPEVAESRSIVAQRDRLLAEAKEHADETLRAAASQAGDLVAAARAEAHGVLESAKDEHARLVSAATVHQTATSEADRLTSEARDEAASTTRHAEEYVAKLKLEARDYADRTLSELVGTLQRMASTAENGRVALDRDTD
jgi:cell division septum initiation protein DivIVA